VQAISLNGKPALRSLVMMTAFYVLRVNADNPVALPYFLIQMGFFFVLNIYLLVR
jgi:hypothetical protein